MDRALRGAVVEGNNERLKSLLAGQADPYVKDNEDDNILEVCLVSASHDRYVECVQTLLESSPGLASQSSGYACIVRGAAMR